MFPGTFPFLLGYPVVGILIATLIGVNLHSSGFRKHLAVNSFLKNASGSHLASLLEWRAHWPIEFPCVLFKKRELL